MSVQQLHDALNQLPDDLIAATDALRQRKKEPIPWNWKRLVPIAACFVLVLGALLATMPLMNHKNAAPEAQMSRDEVYSEVAGEPEAAAPAAPAPETPMEQPPMADETGGVVENSGAPLAPEEETDKRGTTAETPVRVYGYCVGSEEPEETRITLISTWTQWEDYLAQMPRLTDAEDFENRYSEDYFDKNQLITVLTTAASSSVRYDIHTIRKTAPGCWELLGTRYSPEWFTDDMEQQLLILELSRMVEPEDVVLLTLTEEYE